MTKIRRTADDPVLTSSRLRGKVQVLPISDAEEALAILYRQAAWHFVCPDIRIVKQRHTTGVIRVEGLPVGSFKIVETRIRPFTDAEDFFYDMDAQSYTTARLAETLNAHWQEPDDFSAYGDIVEIDRLWMDPRFSRNGRLKQSISALLNHLFQDRSLLILKAFPLEYEGKVSELNCDAFDHRMRAMMRHYARTLGVAAFPGASGRDGWMYAIPDRLVGIVPPPRERA